MIVKCPRGLSQDMLINYLMMQENSKSLLDELDIEDVYFVQDRMINLITVKENVKRK